jgi:hypothetical protein
VRRKGTRWRHAALLAAGLAVGAIVTGSPAGAHVGTSISHIWSHLRPKADARYVQKSAVHTLQGHYAVGGTAMSSGDKAWDGISFDFELSLAPTPKFVALGDTPPAECPGDASNPRAEAGFLCIYESDGANHGTPTLLNAGGHSPGASRWGTTLAVPATAGGEFFSYGTWAVTTALSPG